MSQVIEFKMKPNHERYYNEESSWGVYTFITTNEIPEYEEYKDDFYSDCYNNELRQGSLCGKMQKLYLGSEYNVTAKLEYNKKYSSWQYSPINISAIVPKTVEAQKIFLESIVTSRQASILLEAYPNIVEDTINGNTDNIDLEKTKGIKEYTWDIIKEKIVNNYVVSDILIMLQPLGVTYAMIKKILMNYPNTTLLKKTLEENPYILTNINGLGFKKVDALALKLKPELRKSYFRAYAYIKYYLSEIGDDNGHSWTTINTLENAFRDNVCDCEELFPEIIETEKNNNALLYFDESGKRVGLKYYREIEESIFSILRTLDKATGRHTRCNNEDIEKSIIEAEKQQGFSFTQEQKDIIHETTKHNVSVVSGKAGCVDCDTEYFNGIEWKKISEYQDGEKVLQYNKDGTSELIIPLQYHKYNEDYLWHFETKYGIDQCLSDEHNVYYMTSKNNLYHKSFKEVRENHEKHGFKGRFVTTFDYSGIGLPYNEWEIRLKIAIKADGSFKKVKSRPFDCYVNIKKERKKERLEFLLNKNNIIYEKLNGAEGYTVYKFFYKDNSKTFTSEWYNASREQFEIIYDEIFYWDGDFKHKESWFTCIKSDADYIQFVGTSLGYRSSITTYNRTGQEYLTANKKYIRKSIEYIVHFSTRNLIALCYDKRTDHTKTPINKYKTLDGYKYCFTVPSNMLVLRRNNKIFVTGNSGKSSIARGLLNIYKNLGCSIGTCALSAKASQRITEATGFPASTIHRMLGAVGFNKFTYTYINPLPYDVILIDECSMINARLFYDLLQAIKLGSKVILCGDNRQLPPIGFGNIFSDLLELNDVFNVNKLTKVHRQAEKSGILTDANLIREGINPLERPELKIVHGELQDMYYMFRDSREALNDIAINTYLKSVKKDGLDNVVIITPRKTDCLNSTSVINEIIQDKLISNKEPYILRGKTKFKLGAKIIQRVNNYDKNIFNGEIGYITNIYKEGSTSKFTVKYPNKEIEYTQNESNQIELAYALTIHLSQGSGYKTVIVIIDNNHYALLDSCLLYTAITRTKERCLLLSEPVAYKISVSKNKSIERQTWLKEFDKDVEFSIKYDSNNDNNSLNDLTDKEDNF